MFYINSLERIYIYIEKEIVKIFSFDSIIDEFKDLKERRTIIYIYVCDFFCSYNYTKLFIHFYCVSDNN